MEQKYVVVKPVKSMGISILLSLLFGPIGLFYSSIAGGVIMSLLSLIIGVLTMGIGAFVLWPVCAVWGAVSVRHYNRALAADSAA